MFSIAAFALIKPPLCELLLTDQSLNVDYAQSSCIPTAITYIPLVVLFASVLVIQLPPTVHMMCVCVCKFE